MCGWFIAALALDRFKGKLQDFHCEQLSSYFRVVRQYIKDQDIHSITNRPYSGNYGDASQEYDSASKTTSQKMTGGDGKRNKKTNK